MKTNWNQEVTRNPVFANLIGILRKLCQRRLAMRVKSVLFSLVVVVAFVGFVSVGITHAALEFVDWSGTWFSVKVSETGKSGTVVPPGCAVGTNNESTTTTYLLIGDWK